MASLNGLPRQDIPRDLVRYTPGNLANTRHRSQIGTSNRRERFEQETSVALRQLSQSRNGALLSPMMNETIARSTSSLLLRAPSPNGSLLPNASVVGSEVGSDRGLFVDSLHCRGNRSFTPESFFYQSHLVGAGGQLGVGDGLPQSRLRAASRSTASSPAPSSMLQLLQQQKAARQGGGVCVGLAAAVPSAGAEDLTAAGMCRAITASVEPKQTSAMPSPQIGERRSRTPHGLSADPSTFFVAVAGRSDPNRSSTMPHLPEAPKPKFRQELTDYHPTWTVTQAPSNAGQYLSESGRFGGYDRGLSSSLVPQVEKASRLTLQQLKAERRRAAEDRCYQHCEQRDLQLGCKKENAILHLHQAAVSAWRVEQQQKRREMENSF